ncbi:MAG: hypothetical protein J2P18_18130 [Nocardia sp.]|nr:hypothetical protein [Nocardia sp.]
MIRRVAAAVLTTAALTAPLTISGPQASAVPPGIRAPSPQQQRIENLLCEMHNYLGVGRCIYHLHPH